jgi:hypothetical protein
VSNQNKRIDSGVRAIIENETTLFVLVDWFSDFPFTIHGADERECGIREGHRDFCMALLGNAYRIDERLGDRLLSAVMKGKDKLWQRELLRQRKGVAHPTAEVPED